MQQQELARHLSVNPTEIVYAITMETVLSAIVNRLGDEALTLSVDDLHLARDEVRAAIDHNLDIRDCVHGGTKAWSVLIDHQLTEPRHILPVLPVAFILPLLVKSLHLVGFDLVLDQDGLPLVRIARFILSCIGITDGP